MNTLECYFIKKLIEQIKDDYMTPKYKAEVALDTVVSIFIDGIINQYLHINRLLNERVVSISKEFPLKKIGNNQSKNIDFLYVNKNTLYAVELKTTSNSYDKEQLEGYINAARRIEEEGNAVFLLDDYHSIMSKTKQSKKYKWQLENKVNNALNQIEKLECIDEVKIIYIVPTSMLSELYSKDSRIICISLQDLAEIVLTEEFIDKDMAETWEYVKLLFNDINNMDLEC